MPIPAAYEVVDPGVGYYQSGFINYARSFGLVNFFSGDYARIEMSVLTNYTDPADNATVLLNGTQIGKIDPRPWTNHFVIPLEKVEFIFPASILRDAVATFQGNDLVVNTVAMRGVFIGGVVCHFRTL